MLVLLPVCFGFTWPGRVAHRAYLAEHGTLEERVQAVRLLRGDSSEQAATALLEALEDDELAVQLEAANALGHAGVAAATPTLIDWLHAREPQRRAAALRALAAVMVSDTDGRIGDDPGDMHEARAARDEDRPTSAMAGAGETRTHREDDREQLETARDMRAVLTREATRALDDAEFDVRAAAVEALAAVVATSTRPELGALAEPARVALVHALDDREPDVRAAAVRALAENITAASLSALIAHAHDSDASVRVELLRALGHARDAKALPVLQQALKDADARVELAAIAALGDSNAAATIAPLRALLGGAAAVSGDAISPAAARALRAARSAAAALGRIDDAHALAALAGVLDRPELTTYTVAAMLERSRRLARADEWSATAAALEQGVQQAHAPAQTEELRRAQAAIAPFVSEIAAHEDKAAIPAADGGDAGALISAVQQLRAATRETAPERLRALSGELIRYGATPALTPALRDELLALLRERVTDPEPSTAAYALDALRALHDPRAAGVIALLLRTGSATRRAAAVCALADFPHTDTRRLLRFLMQNEGPRIAECAALALAEVGDERDAGALLHVTERGMWPLPAAVSYALTRIAQRGVTRKHNLERVLCELNDKPDRYVQANVAAGLALLHAQPCKASERASSELGADVPSALRVARAQLWRALTPRDHDTDRALAQCSAASDPEVAQACAGIGVVADPASNGGKLDVYAFAPDGTTALREQVVALRLANGSVFVGRTDANGHVLLPAAVGGEVVLEDAADAAPLRKPRPQD